MGVRRRNQGPARRMRIGAFFALVVAFALTQAAASAQLNVPELPLDEPLDLEELLNLDELLDGELPVAGDLGDVVDGVTGEIGGLLGESTDDAPSHKGKPKPPPARRIAPPVPTVESWSTDNFAPPSGLLLPGTQVSSTNLTRPSYGAAVGEGFSRAARRAAELAGPVAAPMILALFAVGVLFVAARGPGRLVKIEDERKAFGEQRTFRL